MSKNLNYWFRGRLISTLTNGDRPPNTTDIQAQIPILFGGGELWNLLIAKNAPRFLALQPVPPECLWVAFWISKAFKGSRNFLYIEPMENLIDFLKPTHVSDIWTIESKTLSDLYIGFNQIDLPQYTSYEMLRQQLLMAIHEGGEGFAFS